MDRHFMHYGSGSVAVNLPCEQIARVLMPQTPPATGLSPVELIGRALDHPIASPPLEGIVKPGETVCIVIPDLTRRWQSPHLYVPAIVARLNACGVPDQNITIISATGTHRPQSETEHRSLVGDDVYERVRVFDHDCTDEGNLTYVGTTSRGTEVRLNKLALSHDRLILTGGAIFHFLAGFGGGRKYVLPGIAARGTIMQNHSLALLPGLGAGSNPGVKSGVMDERNPIHMDMMEAAAMATPDFILNIVADADYNIVGAFAGHYIEAHRRACALLSSIDEVAVSERAGLVIATAGGFPKDINLYQTSKTLFNLLEVLEPGGTYILLSECGEGFGSDDTERQITQYATMLERERALRDDFSIGAYIGYAFADSAARHHAILVTGMAPEALAPAGIHAVKTLDEALALARSLNGGQLPKAVLMPHGANTMPVFRA